MWEQGQVKNCLHSFPAAPSVPPLPAEESAPSRPPLPSEEVAEIEEVTLDETSNPIGVSYIVHGRTEFGIG